MKVPTDLVAYERLLTAGAPRELARYKYDQNDLPTSINQVVPDILRSLSSVDTRRHVMVYLEGPTFVGKSSLAVRLAWRQIKTVDASVAWVTPATIAQEMAGNYGALRGDYVNVDVLVIDALEADSRTSAAIVSLLLGRHDAGGTTIITTSLSPDEWIASMTDYVQPNQLSRLQTRVARDLDNGAYCDMRNVPQQGGIK